ncbi:MAG: interleukin-like EMT inducer domain-containing protein, partial [Bacteroidales bacterium]
MTYNYQSKIVYNGTDHAKRRGMNLAIFDTNMNVVFMATYDIYGDTNAVGSLSNKMREITTSQIGVLSTYDAIKSNQTLDDTFKYFGSASWPGTSYLSSYPRTSYAAVICGRKKSIIAEKCSGYGADISPTVTIDVSFENPLTIGYTGYGSPLVSDEGIHENTGANNTVKTWVNAQTLSSLGWKVGDTYLFKGLGEIDAIAAASSTYVEFAVIYQNDSGGELSRVIHRVHCVEGWEEFEIRHTIPSGCTKLTVAATRGTTRAAPRSAQGTVY